MTDAKTENRVNAVRRTEPREERGDAGHVKTGDLTYRPPMDLYDLGERYEILVDLPGSSPEDIDITVHQGTLSIEARVPARYPAEATALLGEYGVGDYRRQVRLGEDVDTEGLTASYVDGVLTVSLPKTANRRPRRVEVRAG